jgi:hypothetical protein
LAVASIPHLQEITVTFEPMPGSRYRMPIVFGPTPGPRQHPEGRMWTLEETGIMSSEWMTVKYRTERAALEALLPPGFALRGEPVVSVSCAWLKNLYWLAGRGYGILSIDIPVTYRGKSETLEGAYCPVIWEGSPEAITTGREELGFPKLFANIPEIAWDRDAGYASCSASGFEHRFVDIEIGGLTEIAGDKTLPGSGGGAQLYYKYIPRSSRGGREGADAAYVTTAAPPQGREEPSANIDFAGFDFRQWQGSGRVAWHAATFEQLPTTFHIVNTLARLPIFETLGATLVAFCGPGIGISMDQLRAVEPA